MRFTSTLLVFTLAVRHLDTASAATVRGVRRLDANYQKLSRNGSHLQRNLEHKKKSKASKQCKSCPDSMISVKQGNVANGGNVGSFTDTAAVTFEIIAPSSPIAKDDSYSKTVAELNDEGGKITGKILSNDRNFDGATGDLPITSIIVVGKNGVPRTYTGSDLNSETVYELENGSFTIDPDTGIVEYTPDATMLGDLQPGETRNDSFTYILTNSDGLTNNGIAPTAPAPTKFQNRARPPTAAPTKGPTAAPVSDPPTASPTAAPVSDPPTKGPTAAPVSDPPTASPTSAPVTPEPTARPTLAPVTPSSTCGIEIDTKCFVEEPHQTKAIDCREVAVTAHSSGELLDVKWSYALTNTCEDDWTVVARQSLQSCELCLESGLQCEKELDFFQPSENECAILDSTGRYLGFPPGCSVSENNVSSEIKVGSEETGRCIYSKEINLRVIEGETPKTVALKYSFAAPMSFGDLGLATPMAQEEAEMGGEKAAEEAQVGSEKAKQEAAEEQKAQQEARKEAEKAQKEAQKAAQKAAEEAAAANENSDENEVKEGTGVMLEEEEMVFLSLAYNRGLVETDSEFVSVAVRQRRGRRRAQAVRRGATSTKKRRETMAK